MGSPACRNNWSSSCGWSAPLARWDRLLRPTAGTDCRTGCTSLCKKRRYYDPNGSPHNLPYLAEIHINPQFFHRCSGYSTILTVVVVLWSRGRQHKQQCGLAGCVSSEQPLSFPCHADNGRACTCVRACRKKTFSLISHRRGRQSHPRASLDPCSLAAALVTAQTAPQRCLWYSDTHCRHPRRSPRSLAQRPSLPAAISATHQMQPCDRTMRPCHATVPSDRASQSRGARWQGRQKAPSTLPKKSPMTRTSGCGAAWPLAA